jgi:hypothetical protein
MFNGMFDIRSFKLPTLNALHIALLESFISALNMSPANELNMITIAQLINNKPKKITPRTSVFNIDDNTKKLTNINGIIRNPTYNNGTKFIESQPIDDIYLTYIILMFVRSPERGTSVGLRGITRYASRG